jgi:hypothetical protein
MDDKAKANIELYKEMLERNKKKMRWISAHFFISKYKMSYSLKP